MEAACHLSFPAFNDFGLCLGLCRLQADRLLMKRQDGGQTMGIQYWTHDIIVVDLPEEPEISDELDEVAERVCDGRGCAVVIDFSDVDIITSSSLSKLLELQMKVAALGNRFVLCCLDDATEGILRAANLDRYFDLVDDRFLALTTMEMIG